MIHYYTLSSFKIRGNVTSVRPHTAGEYPYNVRVFRLDSMCAWEFYGYLPEVLNLPEARSDITSNLKVGQSVMCM